MKEIKKCQKSDKSSFWSVFGLCLFGSDKEPWKSTLSEIKAFRRWLSQTVGLLNLDWFRALIT